MYSRETFIGLYRDFRAPKPPQPPLIALYDPTVVCDGNAIQRPVCLGQVRVTAPIVPSVSQRTNEDSSRVSSKECMVTTIPPINASALLLPVTSISDVVWYYCPTTSESIGPVSLEDLKGYVDMEMLTMSVQIHLSGSQQKWELQQILNAKNQLENPTPCPPQTQVSLCDTNPTHPSNVEGSARTEPKLSTDTLHAKKDIEQKKMPSEEKSFKVSEITWDQARKSRNEKQLESSMKARTHDKPTHMQNLPSEVNRHAAHEKSIGKGNSSNVTIEKNSRGSRRSRQNKNKSNSTVDEKNKARLESPMKYGSSSREEKGTDQLTQSSDSKYGPKPNVWTNTPTMIAGVMTEASRAASEKATTGNGNVTTTPRVESSPVRVQSPIRPVQSSIQTAIDSPEPASLFRKGNAWATPLLKTLRPNEMVTNVLTSQPAEQRLNTSSRSSIDSQPKKSESRRQRERARRQQRVQTLGADRGTTIDAVSNLMNRLSAGISNSDLHQSKKDDGRRRNRRGNLKQDDVSQSN